LYSAFVDYYWKNNNQSYHQKHYCSYTFTSLNQEIEDDYKFDIPAKQEISEFEKLENFNDTIKDLMEGEKLTEKHLDILYKTFAEDLTQQEIGELLGLSGKTIGGILSRLYSKMGKSTKM
jgi:RNA polymerase sigma factor (sigma-70 family)